MDEYKQVGPEKPGYAQDVAQIATVLEKGHTICLKFAANATAQTVVLVRLGGNAWLMAQPDGFRSQDGLFVGIDNSRAAWLPWLTGPLDPGYVGQYLGHDWGWSDPYDTGTEPFVQFLNDVMAATRSAITESELRVLDGNR